MKNFFAMFSIFLFMLLTINTIPIIAQPQQSFSQGIHTLPELNLLPNVAYNVQNNSSAVTFMIIFDSNKVVQQSVRFGPNSIKYVIGPIQMDYMIVILGNGQLVFTQTNVTP